MSTSVKARVPTSAPWHSLPRGPNRRARAKTRWRCREDYCRRGSFTEAIAQVPARTRTIRQLRTQIGVTIGDAARSPAEVVDAHGDRGRPRTASSLPRQHAAQRTVASAGVGHRRDAAGKPRWQRCPIRGRWIRIDPWDTGFVDLSGDQGLLGQRKGRTGAAMIGWLRRVARSFAVCAMENPEDLTERQSAKLAPIAKGRPGLYRTVAAQ